MEAFIFPVFSLIIFLILTEIITVNIKYYETSYIDINFMIFGICLFPKGKRKSNVSRDKKDKKKTKKYTSLRYAFKYLLNHSYINLKELNLTIPDATPKNSALFCAGGIFVSDAILNCIYQNSKNFKSGKIFVGACDNNSFKLEFNTKITFSFLSAVISFLVFVFYSIKFSRRSN